ncbi:MAG: two-component sensor histidine kinase [Bacteroidetes bacterium]|nr:two-component sensor histidine kinase [Bacteroidota bacterium]
MDTTIVPFLNERGKPYQYIAIRADITARKLAEEQIRGLHADLELKVQQRTQDLEAFSYSVSHDLRAPLRTINGYATMLQEDYGQILDNEGKRLLNIVQDGAKKMGMLIDDLLAFSKLGKTDLTKSKIDMRSLVEKVCNDLTRAPGFKAKIEIGNLHPVIADPAMMNQVWVNLLSNAIKYSSNKEKPAVKIASELRKDSVHYSVIDNGVGFDMRYADKLFGVFQRLHSSEDFEGTGVGLAIVHRIISRHKGKTWAKGVPDKGASFYFSLPAENG